MMIENHMLKSRGSTQRNVTLPSAQTELVAAVNPCGESICLTQFAADLGILLVGHVHMDSPAEIGIANRKENGKTPPREGRHAVDTGVSGGGGDHIAEGPGRKQRS